jgi:hypothetical protein
VGMTGVAKRVYGVVAECVYADAAIREDLGLWRVFMEIEGHRDGSQRRPINCVPLWL